MKDSESVKESSKRIEVIKKFHTALEISKLTNLANTAIKLAHIASLNSKDIENTIILTKAVDIVGAANDFIASKVKIN